MYWKWFNDDFTLSLGLIMMLANPSVTVLGIYAYNQLYWTFFYMQNGFAIKSLNGKKCANKSTDLICIDNDKWILIHPRFPLTLKKCLCDYNCLTFTTTFIWLLATVFFSYFHLFLHTLYLLLPSQLLVSAPLLSTATIICEYEQDQIFAFHNILITPY